MYYCNNCHLLLIGLIVVIAIMSGRGRGRTGGHGRHSGRGKDNNKSTMIKTSTKTVKDYVYYVGSAKQAADYETTTDYLINFVKKTFTFGNDIGTVLETLEEFDITKFKPVLYYSYNDDKEAKDFENRQFEMEFKAEYDAYMRRKQALETNMSKAYAFLWEQCSKGMQSKIEARSNFTLEVKGNPIELLKAIKQHA